MPSSTSNYSFSATIKYNIYTSTRLKWKLLELHTLAADRLTVTLSRERGGGGLLMMMIVVQISRCAPRTAFTTSIDIVHSQGQTGEF